MRTLLLLTITCLLVSCVSAARTREAHCLGLTMEDAWHAQEDLQSAEHTWRTASQTRFERSPLRRDASLLSQLIADGYAHSYIDIPRALASRSAGTHPQDYEEERALYRQVSVAHARLKESREWYQRVMRRVQTRMEEDEILYPLLGTLATSTAIVFYPIIRWNTRSLLWEGEDPDNDDDPVQTYCAFRVVQHTAAAEKSIR